MKIRSCGANSWSNFTGEYEPVEVYRSPLDAYQAEDRSLTSRSMLNAASGGFLAPFCSPDLLGTFVCQGPFDQCFGHKFRPGSTLGLAWILWRTAEGFALSKMVPFG